MAARGRREGRGCRAAPLLPPPRPRPKGGRRPIKNRAALTGILFVLRSGLPWEMLPA
ncbi:transposase, partial [Methylobacterium sp. WL30]|uniref:transposase n=1 Tax=Methylobacterium sp. WL30 TaxID=2603895 RepID=UPI0011C861CF